MMLQFAPPPPKSCDTFVFLAGPGTLFGKNSDRPAEEEHEVVYIPGQRHAPGTKVRCTYIEIPQVPQTHAVVLSKPHWMWGCEMGANERGVVGGNEAVSSELAGELVEDGADRLLGMDLLRLALERGSTAREATDVCCRLLEMHGQGGCCSEDGDGWTYENGFLFADENEAFVLETAGIRHWAVERVLPGEWRNISNGLSIRTSVESCSQHIKALCKERGWWDGSSQFDWKACVGSGGRSAGRSLEIWGREKAGAEHLQAMANQKLKENMDGTAFVTAMAKVLRDERSGICFRDVHGFCSTGSQISWLSKGKEGRTKHYFTGSSDPVVSSYKRFEFPGVGASATDHGSLELWKIWRKIALDGGLHKNVHPSGVSSVKVEQSRIEELSFIEAGSSGRILEETFDSAIRSEISLLRRKMGQRNAPEADDG